MKKRGITPNTSTVADSHYVLLWLLVRNSVLSRGHNAGITIAQVAPISPPAIVGNQISNRMTRAKRRQLPAPTIIPSNTEPPHLVNRLEKNCESTAYWISTKKTGVKNMPKSVTPSIPLKTAIPSDRRISAPAPEASTKGTTPSMKANEVIRMGLKRSPLACTAASKRDL